MHRWGESPAPGRFAWAAIHSSHIRHTPCATCAWRVVSLRAMEPTPHHHTAESRFRQLLRSAGLDEPDRVEYAPEELTFFWDGPKVAVVVELERAT